MYSLIVYFLISCISIIYSFHLFINYLRIYYLLYYLFIRIYYSVYYSFMRILLFTHTYFTIHLYVFYYSRIHILLFIYTYFTIYLYIFHYSLFTIYYLLLTIYYLGKNPYLMEFDQTTKFWCPCIARDAWINLTFCSDQF